MPLLHLYSVDGLTFTGNRLERATDHPDGESERKVTDSDHIRIEKPSTFTCD